MAGDVGGGGLVGGGRRGGDVVQGKVAVASGHVADARAGAFGLETRGEGFGVEFVVAVDFVDDARADAEDLEHAGCGAAKDDDGEDDDDEDGGAEGGRVLAGEECCEGDADGSAKTGPEEHRLVVVGELVRGWVGAAALRTVADEPVDDFGEGEDSDPACGDDGEEGDDDEGWLEVVFTVGEQGQTEVDEDEVFN